MAGETGFGFAFDADFIKSIQKADKALEKFNDNVDASSKSVIKAFQDINTKGVAPMIGELEGRLKSLNMLISGIGDSNDSGLRKMKRDATGVVDSINKILDVLYKVNQTETLLGLPNEDYLNYEAKEFSDSLGEYRKNKEQMIAEEKAAHKQMQQEYEEMFRLIDKAEKMEIEAKDEYVRYERQKYSESLDAYRKQKEDMLSVDKHYHDKRQQEYEAMFARLDEFDRQNKQAKTNNSEAIESYRQQLSAYENLFDEAIRREEQAKAEARNYEFQGVIELLDKKKKAETDMRNLEQRNHESKMREYEEMFDALDKAEALSKKRQKALSDATADTSKGALKYAERVLQGQKPQTINNLTRAIQQMSEAQRRLNISTEDGKKKYKELAEKISACENAIDGVKDKTEDLEDENKKLSSTASKLGAALMATFSISSIKGYMKHVIDIRGEFEKQQRSLQILIGSQREANVLWEKTTALAVQSPFRVKDLVTYTKQLAAYRVESGKLYETNKMLADISAGLGVDMNRLILAYGQVKAANYLRGTELRQFSEAGVNILQELADYYSIIENRTVKVGDVFERVTKRMVSFYDVEKVLKDMTSAGGMFFKMQELQAETISGMWSNLKDSLDLMINEIGKKNEGEIKLAISLLKSLMDNYEKFIPILKAVVISFSMFRINAVLASETVLKAAAGFGVFAKNGRSSLTVMQLLTVGAKKLERGFNSLKAAMLSNWWLIVLAALGEVAYAYKKHRDEIKKINESYSELKREISEIESNVLVQLNDQDLKQAKAELNKLSEFAKEKLGIEFKFKYEDATLQDVTTAFDNLKTKINETTGDLQLLELELQNFNSHPLRKDLGTAIGEANTEYGEAILYLEKYAKSVAAATLQSKKASDAQKNAAEALLLPKGDLETELSYYNRLTEAYETIFGMSFEYLNQIGRKNKRNGIEALLGFSIKDLVKQTAESEQALELAKNLYVKYLEGIDFSTYTKERADQMKKSWIDKTAGVMGWSDAIVEYLYQQAGLVYQIVNNTSNVIDDLESKQEKANTVLNARIGLLKDLRSEYLKLLKDFNKIDSESKARDSFRAAFEEAGMDIDKIDFTTETGLIAAFKNLEGLAAAAGKKAQIKLQKEIGEVQVKIDVDNTQKEQKELLEQIEDMFGNYEVSLELDKMNIPPDLAKKIFGIESMDLSELSSAVMAVDTSTFGKDALEKYNEFLKKLDKMEEDARMNRLKTYTKYLREEQDERIKIKLEEIRQLEEVESMNEYDDAQKSTIKTNIRAEAEKDIMKKRWESFEQSPDFLNLFDDMSKATTQSLEDMKTTLDRLKGSMIAAGLPASDLKEILDKINKVEEELENRKPFQSLKEDWSTLFGSEYKKALDDEKTLLKERRSLEDEKKAIEDSGPDDFQLNILNTEKEMLSAMEKGSEEYRQQKELVDSITKSLYPNQERYEEILKLLEQNGVQLDEVQQKTRKWKDSCEDIAEHFIAIGDAVNQVGGALGTTLVQMGLMSEETKAIYDSYMSVADNAFNLGGNVMKLIANPTDPQAWVGAITNTIAMIGNIAATGDAIREKQIQSEMKKIERLEKAYEKLEKAMEDAYTIDQMRTNKASMEQNIDAQIKALESAKAKEEANKNTDEDAVQQYTDDIEKLIEQKEELEREMVETMGGTYDYASVAEQFLDAWLSAFEETGDGLSGLDEAFDDFWKNVMKKQVVYGGASKILEGYISEINERLKDGVLDDQDVNILEGLEEETKANLKEFFEYINSKYDLASMGESELSGLQKGIQGITETQADILAAYWNAVRFDVSAIRQRFEEYLATQGIAEDTNPMMTVLNSQLEQLKAIRGVLDDATSGGNGISGAFRVRVVEMN